MKKLFSAELTETDH